MLVPSRGIADFINHHSKDSTAWFYRSLVTDLRSYMDENYCTVGDIKSVLDYAISATENSMDVHAICRTIQQPMKKYGVNENTVKEEDLRHGT